RHGGEGAAARAARAGAAAAGAHSQLLGGVSEGALALEARGGLPRVREASAVHGGPSAIRCGARADRRPLITGVVLAQDIQDLGAREFRRHGAPLGQPLAQLGARNLQLVLLAM